MGGRLPAIESLTTVLCTVYIIYLKCHIVQPDLATELNHAFSRGAMTAIYVFSLSLLSRHYSLDSVQHQGFSCGTRWLSHFGAPHLASLAGLLEAPSEPPCLASAQDGLGSNGVQMVKGRLLPWV